jgi:2-polyprenyl-3-methyl-5-hydroxy-6-metoxy-1,4-benzoquinol methylase
MDKDKIRANVDKVYGDMASAMAVAMAYLGVETGLFECLKGKGALTLDEVTKQSGLDSRYVEEWLKGMASVGYLDYDPANETFTLTPELSYLIASEGTDHYMSGMFLMMPHLMRVAPQVAQAFKQGGGVRFQEIGADGVKALDALNAGLYAHRFSDYWLGAVPGLVERLENGARILDVGCGVGRVCVALSRAYPNSEVTGLDPDTESIRQARAIAAQAGLEGGIDFVAQTTGELDAGQGFDLITLCDCLHDFAEPGNTLGEIRNLLKPGGVMFVVEPKAADRLEDNLNPVAAVYYGFSLLHCMTQSLAQGGPGLGTCLGPAATRALLADAQFEQIEQLDIKSQTHLFYSATR